MKKDIFLLFFLLYSLISGQVTVIDTCTDNGNQNMLGGTWYVYDDNPKRPDCSGIYIDTLDLFIDSLNGGNTRITNFEKIDIREYENFSMTVPGGVNTSYSCAFVAAQFGDTMPHWGQGMDEVYGNYWGLVTFLTPNETPLDLSTAYKISYWAKASDTIAVDFIIETDQGRFRFFDSFYRVSHIVTPEWQEYYVLIDTVNVNDSLVLAQPEWIIFDHPWYPGDPPGVILSVLPLDISKVLSVRWELGGAGELGHFNMSWYMRPCTLWVDDIAIYGFNMVYHTLWITPESGTSFYDSLEVTIGSSSDRVYVTTDGTEPDSTDTTQLYTGPFFISGDTVVVKALATGGQYLNTRKSWVYFGATTSLLADIYTVPQELSCTVDARGRLQIRIPNTCDREFKISLYTICGRTVFTKYISGKRLHTIPLPERGIGRGIYMVQITDGIHDISRRIMVK